MMSGAFSLVNVLADSLGPGTVGFNGEPKDFFMASAGLCLVGFNCSIVSCIALSKYLLDERILVLHYPLWKSSSGS